MPFGIFCELTLVLPSQIPKPFIVLHKFPVMMCTGGATRNVPHLFECLIIVTIMFYVGLSIVLCHFVCFVKIKISAIFSQLHSGALFY